MLDSRGPQVMRTCKTFMKHIMNVNCTEDMFSFQLIDLFWCLEEDFNDYLFLVRFMILILEFRSEKIFARISSHIFLLN